MALVERTAEAEMENAHGKALTEYKDKDGNPLPAKVKYKYSWFEYDDNPSFIAAKEELTIDRQRKVVNNDRKTTAYQAAKTATLDSLGIVRPNAENDSQVRLKSVYAGFYGKYIGAGMSPDEARTKARAKAAEMLEEKWDDDDEG